MKIEIQIDGSCKETEVIIVTDRMTDEVNDILRRLSEEQPRMIAGFRDGAVTILEPGDIFRVYAASGKVYAETARGEFVLRLRLYEAEQRLDKHSFVRISNSDIVNLKKVRDFDLSITGTICVTLTNGTVTYVSRRYVTRIKEQLGI